MELYIPACIPADLKNCTHESPRALSHNETHAAMCCRKPRHLQKHHSPSEIVHPTRRFLSLPSASKLYLKKLQIFLLHLTHMIHHEFYGIPLYLYLLLPRNFFFTDPAKEIQSLLDHRGWSPSHPWSGTDEAHQAPARLPPPSKDLYGLSPRCDRKTKACSGLSKGCECTSTKSVTYHMPLLSLLCTSNLALHPHRVSVRGCLFWSVLSKCFSDLYPSNEYTNLLHVTSLVLG